MSNTIWKPSLPAFRKYKKDIFGKIIKTGQFMHQIGESDALRQKSKQVNIKDITSKEFKAKVNYLKKCILNYRKITGVGRGITAVQVGIPEAFSVTFMPELKDHPVDSNGLLIIINPKITKKSEKLLRYPEMCMSAMPIIAKNVRSAWVEFEYYDEAGIKRFWNNKDTDKTNRMYNRVFQHEIDHINGIINIDRVKSRELILESDPTYYDKAKFEEFKEKSA